MQCFRKNKVKLVSLDNEEFSVDPETARMSMLFKSMLDLGLPPVGLDDNDDHLRPIVNVRGDILRRVFEWSRFHKDDPPMNDTREKRTDDIVEWDKEFLNVDQTILFDLMLAADYLDIQGLFDVTCRTVANIQGKTPEEIHHSFMLNGICDFTPDEEEK